MEYTWVEVARIIKCDSQELTMSRPNKNLYIYIYIYIYIYDNQVIGMSSS